MVKCLECKKEMNDDKVKSCSLHCKLCGKKLASWNKSGYCTACYTSSPQYKEYQRKKQNEWYAKKENKIKKKEYRQKPEVKKRVSQYQKKYRQKNIERIRELKRNWARKNKEKRK